MIDTKCSTKHCRNEIEVYLRGKGLCAKCWQDYCAGKLDVKGI